MWVYGRVAEQKFPSLSKVSKDQQVLAIRSPCRNCGLPSNIMALIASGCGVDP